VETSWAHPQSQPLQLSAELVGARGRLAWDYESISSLRVIGDQGHTKDFILLGEDSYAAEVAAFVECVERDTTPPVTAEEGQAALRVALAASESLETGRSVRL
jgi:myo-inositol 2-dehydrogenase/D-chiro-inositol 1-dehydrogenase